MRPVKKKEITPNSKYTYICKTLLYPPKNLCLFFDLFIKVKI